MRVAILGLRALFGAQGGIETHVRDIVCHAARSPHTKIAFEVMERAPYASPEGAMPSDIHGVSLMPLWAPRSSHFEAILHSTLAVLWCALRRPDVVHIHGIGPSLVAPLARLFGLRVVTTHHGTDYDRAKWSAFAKRVLRLGEWCGARFSHARIVIAPGLDERLKQAYGVGYTYIPNAVPPAAPPARWAESDLLARYGLTKGRYIVNVARIVPEKRQLDLIDAFIAAGEADAKLVLIGGADHGSDYAQAVTARAATDPRIVMTGALPKDSVNALYAGAAAFVLPSSHEGLPISLLEAMSFGLPVAVSRLPTLAGLKLPADCYVDDAKSLERTVARLTRGGVRINWTPFLERYSIDSVTRRTLEVYHAVAGNRVAAPVETTDTAEPEAVLP